jgi:hypothetical protein
MPQPYNYSLNVPNPAQAITQGLQTGVQLGEAQAQARQRDAQFAAQQAQVQRRQQFQQAIVGLGGNPSAKQLSGLLLQFPEMSELYKEGYTRLSSEEQKERTSQASTVYSAVLAGDNDLAVKQLNEYATAYRNSGREDDAKALETQAKLIELHPETAERGVSLFLANAMGPEKFESTFGQLQDQRRKTATEKSDLTIKEKQAEQEVVKSKFAEQTAELGLNLTREQIRNLSLEPDFKRANLRILTLNAELAKETNTLKKQELQGKIEDANLARAEKARTRIADAQTGAASIDSLLNTADELLQTPIGVVRNATGPFDSRLLTLGTATANFEAKLETIDAKAFLAQIPNLKGLGALSNAEGEQLRKSLTNLGLKQGQEQLFKNLQEAQRLMLIARENLATRYGVELGAPNTPAAALDPDSDDVNALVRGAQTGGATANY